MQENKRLDKEVQTLSNNLSATLGSRKDLPQELARALGRAILLERQGCSGMV